ncbi:LytR/AlgR family response regulator transcription factor, partial [Ideonella sp.]|uniref:LytR/AlgR family response regulator transcription factor n=1 Tax=Ideonella sp. TaxID=1929293 RepID=UPI003BB70585
TRTAVICEDEPLARETLRDFIAARPELTLVGEAADGVQALKLIRALQPDIVFMDIQMPEMTGLEVVRQLPDLPALIFTTAYDQHAVTAFELNAADYLLKPFSRERFDRAVQRVLDEAPLPREVAEQALEGAEAARLAMAASPLTRLLVRDRNQIFPISIGEIEYLKSDAKYTVIAARGSQYYVRIPLSELEPRLNPERFLRVHRNAIVNLDFVLSMKPDDQSQLEIFMRDGSRLLANREASKRLRDQAV